MMSMFTRLASLKLTLFGILAVIVLAVLSNKGPELSIGWVVLPLAILSLNLLAAIVTNSTFRNQPALLVFHVCLLSVVVLLGIGLLIRFDGHFELTEGETFDPSVVQVTEQGAWHPSNLGSVSFKQGEIEVAYLPGLVRRDTRSLIAENRPGGRIRNVVIGDRVNANINGYRFMATFNKGLAVVVVWSDAFGNLQRGSINFPSYPEYEWKQVNTWTTPGGEEVKLELKPAAQIARDEAWVLRSDSVPFAIELKWGANPLRVLRLGDTIRLRNGMLRIEGLRLWMGYRIDYYPLLSWVFTAALFALVALAIHFQTKFWPARRPAQSTYTGGVMAHDGCD